MTSRALLVLLFLACTVVAGIGGEDEFAFPTPLTPDSSARVTKLASAEGTGSSTT